jgi:hypothetical protein
VRELMVVCLLPAKDKKKKKENENNSKNKQIK